MPLSDTVLRSLLDHAPYGVFVADEHGCYEYVNRSAGAMLGYEPSDLVGKTIVDLLHPDEHAALRASRDAMLQGAPHVGEWRLRHRDGHWVPVEVTATMVPHWQAYVRDISERKQREQDRLRMVEALERDRTWLRAVIERLPMAIALHRTDGSFSFNEQAERLIGMPLKESEGASQYAHRVFYADGRPVPREELPSARALSRGETTFASDYLVRGDKETLVPVLVSAAPVTDAQGVVIGAVATYQDMSERMRLQRAVQDNERLLQSVFDLLPVGVSIADGTGRIVRANAAADAIWRGPGGVEFGERKATWLRTGQPVAPHEWPAVRAATRGEVLRGELVRIRCFDGSVRTVVKSAMPLRAPTGAITGAIVVDEDVTDVYQAQEKVAASERLFRTVFELLPVGLWIADAGGTIVRGNPAGDRIWQGIRHVGPEHFAEYKAWWVDTGEPIAPDDWAVARAVRRGETSRGELIRIQCFDGTFRTVINWATPIRSDTGEIEGAVALNEDVTALYRTQEQLRSAVRDREHILAVVAHDLRSPLNSLLLRAQIARQQALRADADPAACAAAADGIMELARNMAALVDDLLAVSVARAGQSMLQIRRVQAAALVAKAADIARPGLESRGLRLEVRCAPDLPDIQVDEARIQRVFANLLDNAGKFTERGGSIRIEAQPAAGSVVFGVSNTGPALRPDERERLFQPFWQAGREDRRGAGLGLSICRSIIEAHGGSVWTEAAAGMRLKVLFLLPRAAAEPRAMLPALVPAA